MTKVLSSAEVKNHFSEVIHRVAYAHERVVIERRGKPLAVVVSLEDLRVLEAKEKQASKSHGPGGLAACAGLFGDMPEVCETLDFVVKERHVEFGRPPLKLD